MSLRDVARRTVLGVALLGTACGRPGGDGAAAAAAAPPAASRSLPVASIRLPPGFRIAVFTASVPGARSLALGDKGTVFVGTRKDTVYAVVDADRDGVAEAVHAVARGLDTPNGVAFRQGALYVAEVSRVLRYDAMEDRLGSPPAPVTVVDGLPREKHHGWKFIAFGPDGRLYVPVGAPCNVCESKDPRFASILRFTADGQPVDTMAQGVRNTVGFDWEPGTGVLWFTDNGRDLLGDDVPPDELNRAPDAGRHYGYPYCHGGTLPDPVLGRGRPCSEFVPPARTLDPHVAAIGMRFYRGSLFPREYRGQVLIAEHGSWNRSRKIGYRVMLVKVKDGQALSYEPFAEGWLQGQDDWGRPVDVLELSDGSVLVSDDKADAIYRITYGP